MTTLDTLARSSAAAIHQSVAFVPVPVGGIAKTSRALVFRRSLGYAFAGAAAAVIAVFAMLAVATPVDEVTDVTNTTLLTTTTVAEATIESTIPTDPPDNFTPVVPPEVSRDIAPSDTSPPHIAIVSPESGVETTRSAILVTGVAEEGARVTGQTDSPVDVADDGVWSSEVELKIGSNRIVFTAIDKAGNFATASVIVTRTPPPTTTTTKPVETTTTTEAPIWEFTAHKTYGTCSDNPPYDIYYGTGKPGTEISVTSEYGGGSTTVNESGEFSVKVFFNEAPAHAGFAVKVKHLYDGSKKTFEFTYTPE